jgi:hypothetical protein
MHPKVHPWQATRKVRGLNPRLSTAGTQRTLQNPIPFLPLPTRYVIQTFVAHRVIPCSHVSSPVSSKLAT